MKIYVHIKNDCVKNDRSIMDVVECEGIPQRGDLFYTSKECEAKLLKMAKYEWGDIVKRGEYTGYDNWVYQDKELDFGDAIVVGDVSWEMDKDGIYRCHIELTDMVDDRYYDLLK